MIGHNPAGSLKLHGEELTFTVPSYVALDTGLNRVQCILLCIEKTKLCSTQWPIHQKECCYVDP